MFALGLAAAAYYIGAYLIGARGWWLLAPLIILLIINPAWGAVFFLIVAGILLVGGILWLIWTFLPQIIGFILGIWLVFMLIIGLGQLAGG